MEYISNKYHFYLKCDASSSDFYFKTQEEMARLFAESREALKAERRAYGELSREAWTELLRSWPRFHQ